MSASPGGSQAVRRDYPELTLLVGAIAVALGVFLFVLLALTVHLGGTQSFDNWTLRTIRQVVLKNPVTGQIYGVEAAIAFTSLGTLVILIPLTCCVMGFLWLTRNPKPARLLLATLLGAIAINYGLKWSFGRTRPVVVQGLQLVDSKSFPSGHALTSTAVYAALGLISAGFVRGRALKIYLMSLALALSFVIGLTRMYLGVHYPTDVLAGWLIGLSWALFCWLAARFLERQRA